MSRISDYLSAVTDNKSDRGDADTQQATERAYGKLTRSDCGKLWPNSPESKDSSRDK